MKKEMKTGTELGFNTVVNGLNWQRLPRIMELAGDLELSFVWVFSYLAMGEGLPNYVIPEEGLKQVKDFIRQYNRTPSSRCRLYAVPALRSSHPIAKKLPNSTTTTMGKRNQKPNLDRCGAIYSMMNIKADGTVVACCINPTVMGRLNEQTIEEIWNGPEYQKLRRNLNEHKAEGVCRYCFDGLRYRVNR